jgi:archaellum component FlaC
MMDLMLWNLILSAMLGVMAWVLKDKAEELKRLGILLNKTREEVARDYVTRTEIHADIARVLDRLDRLDEKLDRLVEKRHGN